MSNYDDWKKRSSERAERRRAEREEASKKAKQGKKLRDDPEYMRKYRQKQKDEGIMGDTKPGSKWDKLGR